MSIRWNSAEHRPTVRFANYAEDFTPLSDSRLWLVGVKNAESWRSSLEAIGHTSRADSTSVEHNLYNIIDASLFLPLHVNICSLPITSFRGT